METSVVSCVNLLRSESSWLWPPAWLCCYWLAAWLGFPSCEVGYQHLTGWACWGVGVNVPPVPGTQQGHRLSGPVWNPSPMTPLSLEVQSLTGRHPLTMAICASVWSKLQPPVSGCEPSTSEKCEFPITSLQLLTQGPSSRAIPSLSWPGLSSLKRVPGEKGKGFLLIIHVQEQGWVYLPG